MEDRQIIHLFQERSEAAVEELAQKYGKLCRAVSYNILKNEQDAEECVNDAFFAVWNTIPPEEPDILQAYVCRIVRNLSVKRYRFNTAQKRNSHYDMVLEEVADCLESSAEVEEEILLRELAGCINDFLGALKTRERVMFVQRYWYCVPIAEIAENVSMSKNAVAVHLHRTRRKLKTYLEKRGLKT